MIDGMPLNFAFTVGRLGLRRLPTHYLLQPPGELRILVAPDKQRPTVGSDSGARPLSALRSALHQTLSGDLMSDVAYNGIVRHETQDYRLIRRLGEGWSGVAWHARLKVAKFGLAAGHDVALKLYKAAIFSTRTRHPPPHRARSAARAATLPPEPAPRFRARGSRRCPRRARALRS